MASKKKRRPASGGTKRAKSGRSASKAGARKAAARSGSRGAKRAAGRKRASGAAKTRPAVRKTKTRPPQAKARAPKADAAPKKRPTRTADSAPAKAPTARSGPPLLDEVLEEPLYDASTILRIKDRVARSQRDVDEDELRRFPDPSLVVEAQSTDVPRGDDAEPEESSTPLPELFAAEARRQAARAAESPPDGAASTGHNGSLFGSLGLGAPKEDRDADPEDRDDD